MTRKEFTRDVKAEIVRRATIATGITCETCSATGLKPRQFHVDHSTATGLVTAKRKLTAKDGTVMCLQCHRAKTSLDVASITKAKAVEAKHLGIAAKPKGTIAAPPRAERTSSKPSLLPRNLYRRMST